MGLCGSASTFTASLASIVQPGDQGTVEEWCRMTTHNVTMMTLMTSGNPLNFDCSWCTMRISSVVIFHIKTVNLLSDGKSFYISTFVFAAIVIAVWWRHKSRRHQLGVSYPNHVDDSDGCGWKFDSLLWSLLQRYNYYIPLQHSLLLKLLCLKGVWIA